MIDVPELDIYLKTFFYFLNHRAEFYSTVSFSDELKSWLQFINNNQGILQGFEETVEKPDFGFDFFIGPTASMLGDREFQNIRDPLLIRPAQYLKIYARLIYANEFLTEPQSFDSYRYFLRYYPNMIVTVYKRIQGSENFNLIPGHYWVTGSHTTRDSNHLISYNVTAPVGISTIVEEELHGQETLVHGTTTKEEIVNQIRSSRPEIIEEIEENMNLILSAEEKRFKELGDVLRVENSSELRTLETFVELFEKEVIESTRVNSSPTP